MVNVLVKYSVKPGCIAIFDMVTQWKYHISFPWTDIHEDHFPLKSLQCILFHQKPMGLLALSCACFRCVFNNDLWPLCLCLQITSEVHLFSHTKGKRHQQAVRDSSSIQGRELSDEEVVRITYTLPGTNRHLYCWRIVLRCCLWQSNTAVIFYDMVIIIVYASLYLLPGLCCWLCEITNGPWNVHS